MNNFQKRCAVAVVGFALQLSVAQRVNAGEATVTSLSTSSEKLAQTLANMRSGDVLVKTQDGASLVQQLDRKKTSVLSITPNGINVRQTGPAPPPKPPGCGSTPRIELLPSWTDAVSRFQNAASGTVLIASESGFHLAQSESKTVSISVAGRKIDVTQTGPAPAPKPPTGC
jgi:hypothetical protein